MAHLSKPKSYLETYLETCKRGILRNLYSIYDEAFWENI